MKNLKDLTVEIAKLESKDRFYQVNAIIERLLAPQHYKRPFTYTKKGWGEIVRVEQTVDGTPTDLTAPKRRRKARKGESEVKVGDCWTFKEDKGDLYLPWATGFGLCKSALRRSLEAQRRLRYDSLPLNLMKVYPLWLNVGKAPCESMKEDRLPEIVLETRHTQSGDVRVEAFFDYIENREVQWLMEVDSECPINEEKFVALVKTVNTLDVIGPSKRGSMRILKLVQVEPDAKELEKMQKGEPTQPVIY